MKIAAWNIRGFNMPLKHNGVHHLIRQQCIDIIGVLETKINRRKLARILRNRFSGWRHTDNFLSHPAGRILILWDQAKAELRVLETTPQVIHCEVTCKVTSNTFRLSFVYGFHSIVTRRTLWSNLIEFGAACSIPWLIMGDFNNVLRTDERCNGADVTPYETRDFADCCLTAGLTDLRSIGCHYTWTKNSVGGISSVWSKLDRAMVNELWQQTGLHALADFQPAGCLSDHSPCIVSFFQQSGEKGKHFKFFNMWTEHADFQNVVSSSWNQQIYGTKQFSLCKKLKGLKNDLKQLNNKHFTHISVRAEKARNDLKAAQLDLHDQPTNIEVQNKVALLRKQAVVTCDAERSFYYQQAKCAYLTKSDKCTKFFHSLVKRNAKRNYVAAIMKDDGTPTTSQSEVATEFVGYYRNLLGTYSTCDPIDSNIFGEGPRLSLEHADSLVRDISQQEIKDALFSIGDDKSPGPDGYSSCFFKAAWETIKDDFVDAITEFFGTGSLLKQANHTVITLIPKGSHSSTVGDFRPISCCNVIYKTITKILSNRLAPVLGSIIDESQAAFIKGRSLIENVHLAQELLRQYNRKRVSPRCVLKIDLRKAYDSINWEFLESVLEGLGFPSRFTQWVMECISTPSFSIAINGSTHGFFKGKRGIRQGDPLSPFLFVICLEYLSRSMKAATNNTEFNYHPKCGPLKITHLAFADDLMLFARGDTTSVRIMMQCLEQFGDCSGLRMNANKSNIFTAGIQGQDLDEIQELVNMPRGSMPFRYLGIPLAAEKLKVNHYAPFLDKIAAYIHAWTSTSLSYAGRAELVRSVVQGVECFWLSIFPIPAAVTSRIIRLCRNFLWNSKKPLVAWSEVCLPKSEGGLGFRDIKCWNNALLAKSLWNIHAKKDTLWVRWVNHVYLRGASIWELSSKKDDSPLLKKIVSIASYFKDTEGSTQAACQKLTEWIHGDNIRIAEAYDYFRPKGEKIVWAKDVWSSYIPPKLSFILWLSAKTKLLTKDRLQFLEIDNRCILCQDLSESVQHLFFQCSMSREIWGHIKRWLGITRAMSTIPSALKWIKKEGHGTSWQCKAKKIALASTVYHIWTARNRLIFEDLRPNPDSIVIRIKTQVYKVMFSLYPHVLNHYESLALGI